MKKNIYIIFSYILLFQVSVNNTYADLFGKEKLSKDLQTGDNLGLIKITDNIFGYLISLLYFIAIVFAIYGGFMILTSGGDDEKVKKGKNIVIYMVLGLIVIFLGSNIVKWVIDVMSSKEITG